MPEAIEIGQVNDTSPSPPAPSSPSALEAAVPPPPEPIEATPVRGQELLELPAVAAADRPDVAAVNDNDHAAVKQLPPPAPQPPVPEAAEKETVDVMKGGGDEHQTGEPLDAGSNLDIALCEVDFAPPARR